jgi:hypothetical protein
MIQAKKSLALVALVITLVACSDDGKGPGNSDAYQGKQGGGTGNECSQQFVSEYNDVSQAVRDVQADLQLSDTQANRSQTRSDAQTLKNRASAFKSKYAGVACVALLNAVRETVDVNSRMDIAVQAADQVIAGLNASNPPSSGGTPTGRVTPPATGPQECSQTFIEDYNSVAHFGTVLSDDLDVLRLNDTPSNRAQLRADAQTLKDKAKAFKARYPGVTCVADLNGSRQTIDSDAKMDTIVSLADQVITALNGGGTNGIHVPPSALLAPASRPAVDAIQVISQ